MGLPFSENDKKLALVDLTKSNPANNYKWKIANVK